MTAKTQLIELAAYFESTRQVGHTTAMMNGAKESDCLILAHDYAGAKFIRTLEPKGEVITIGEVSDPKMMGVRKPMLLDNGTVVAVVNIALGEINRLERRIERMKAKVRDMANEIQQS